MSLKSDLRYAFRMLAKKPLFTVVVVATLAIGIGLNTAAFAAVDALLLRPLPGVRDASSLVQVFRAFPGGMEQKYYSNSIPHYFDLREQTTDVFSGIAAWTFMDLSMSSGGHAERVMGLMTSANYFQVLGVTPQRGRLFAPAEDSGRGAHPVVVLSDIAWRTKFGADSTIINRSVVINGHPWTIIGIAPPGFAGIIPIVTPDIYVPLVQYSQIRPTDTTGYTRRSSNFMNVIARLKPGVTLAQAGVRTAAITLQQRAAFPDDYKDTGITLVRQADAGIHPMFKSAEVGMTGAVMAVVVILLLIACVNVANLFLARARDRAREMAVRLSLGAARGELIRQLVTESLVFSLIAGAAGLLVAMAAIQMVNNVPFPFDITFTPDIRLSPTVLVFTFAASLVTGLLFGLAPALQATRPSLIPALKGETPAGAGRSRMSRGLVLGQMALSIVLLVVAGLFLRNLQAATTVDKGFDSEHVIVAGVNPALQGYERGRSKAFLAQLTDRLKATPGIRSVAYCDLVPLSLSENDQGVKIPGYVPGKNENMSIMRNAVSPDYFTTMGMRFVRGRGIEARDDSASQAVIVINEEFAKRFWKGRDPLGQTVQLGKVDHTVIGVVPTGKYQRIGEEPSPFMYLAHAQHWDADVVFVVKAEGDPMLAAPGFRAAVAGLDSDMPLSNLRTMNKLMGVALLPARITAAVLGVFGVIGLLLACVGMYGVMAYSVSQRTREIGIRVAIGAGSRDVVGMVMRQGLVLTLAGTAVGLVGALGAAKLLGGVLYGSGFDPVTLVGVPVLLLAVSALAIWIPARRAAGIDPILALRQE